MKQMNPNTAPKNTLSSILVKLGVFLLFLGLVYRLTSLQFSPEFLADTDGLKALEAPPPQVPAHAAELPPETTPENSADVSEKCNLFLGDWVPDPRGPRYTNSTCRTIEGPQDCTTNGRPDFDYAYWKWKPRDCDLPKFDPKKFLYMMQGKSLAFIGDSIMRNHVQSLLCMLSEVEEGMDIYHDKPYKNRKWSFPSYNFIVSLVWSPYLTKSVTFEDDNGVSTGLTKLYLDELDTVWTSQYENFDYVVIAGGKWFLKNGLYYENNTLSGCHNCHSPNITQLGYGYAYKKALNSTLGFITSKSRARKPFVLFRSSAPDHFENGEWNTGGYCNRTTPFKTGEIEINDTDEIMRRVELEEFEKAAEKGNENGVKVKLFDATVISLLRPDGHPGAYRKFHPFEGIDMNEAKIQNDCLHWCLPGPIDSWNDLVMEMLVEDFN